MYKVLLDKKVTWLHGTEVTFLKILADNYKMLKTGIYKFYHNGEVVATVERSHVLAVIEED